MRGGGLPCGVAGCEAPAYCRGLCTTHYQRLLKHGERLVVVEDERPNVHAETGGACMLAEGPCSTRTCRYHCAEPRRNGLTSEPNLSEPCALKLAEIGGMTLEEVATILGVSRERIRQVETSALRSLRRSLARHGIDERLVEGLAHPTMENVP